VDSKLFMGLKFSQVIFLKNNDFKKLFTGLKIFEVTRKKSQLTKIVYTPVFKKNREKFISKTRRINNKIKIKKKGNKEK
jgi:hypothetical protein